MPKIVILGSQGFIFSHVVEYFLDLGWEVYGFDFLGAGSHPELVAPFKARGMHFYEVDASHAPIVRMITEINPEYIIHAAAISDVDYSLANPTKTLLSNNGATINAFEAARRCRRLKKFLYVSTDEVYGECDHPKTETELLFPRNPYALSKAYGSLMRIAYDNSYPELKDKTVETRFCNVFGGRQDTRKIIPAIKVALAGGAPLKLHNDGEGFRQWIHISEIPPILESLLLQGNRTYNITSGFGCTVNALIETTETLTGRKVPTIPGKRSGMDMRYEMSSSRLEQDFGWRLQRPAIDALMEELKS